MQTPGNASICILHFCFIYPQRIQSPLIIVFVQKMQYIKFTIIIILYILNYIPVPFFLLTTFYNNELLIPIDIMNGTFMVYGRKSIFFMSFIMIKEGFVSIKIG